MSAVADKLRAARALIERWWTQGAFVGPNRQTNGLCYCLYGAINQVVVGDPEADTDVTAPYEKALAKVLGRDPLDMANWNDDPERTQTEVLAAFDKAIELAERDQ